MYNGEAQGPDRGREREPPMLDRTQVCCSGGAACHRKTHRLVVTFLTDCIAYYWVEYNLLPNMFVCTVQVTYVVMRRGLRDLVTHISIIIDFTIVLAFMSTATG